MTEQTTFNPVLIETNALLVKQVEAQRKRIEYLEFVLAQRAAATRRKWNPEKTEEMKDKVRKIFVDNPSVGFTYEEVNAEFFSVYGFRSANVGQRVRDLFKEGVLWKSEDEKGKMRYYLKLEEATPQI